MYTSNATIQYFDNAAQEWQVLVYVPSVPGAFSTCRSVVPSAAMPGPEEIVRNSSIESSMPSDDRSLSERGVDRGTTAPKEKTIAEYLAEGIEEIMSVLAAMME